MDLAELKRRLVGHYASDPARATLVTYYVDVLAAVLDGLDGMGHRLKVMSENSLPPDMVAEGHHEWQRRFVVPDSIEGAMAVVKGLGPHPATQAVPDALRPSEEQRIKEQKS